MLDLMQMIITLKKAPKVTSIFGTSLEDLFNATQMQLPFLLINTIRALSVKGSKVSGIFRFHARCCSD